MSVALLEGKKVDPKEVVASRRKSPGPGEYQIQKHALQVKPKLQVKNGFDSKV